MEHSSQEHDPRPPLLRIPNEMLLAIQSFLEDPNDLAQLAATCRHMWYRLGADDSIHVREARHWARQLRQNQEQHDSKIARDFEVQDEIDNLLADDDNEGAEALLEQHTDSIYPGMRAAHAALRARPPTLILAIERGCHVLVVRRLLRLYRRLIPGGEAVEGRWGVTWQAGPCPTHAAARAGRVDVLRLLAAEGAFHPGVEWQAVVGVGELRGGWRLNRHEPLMAAVYEQQSAVAQYLIDAGRCFVTDDHVAMAAQLGDADMVRMLVPSWAREGEGEGSAALVPEFLLSLLHLVAEFEADRRAVIDALIDLGAYLGEDVAPSYADQLLPRAIHDRDGPGNLVNVCHLLGRLVMHNSLSLASFSRVVEDAARAYPGHEFLRYAIPYAYLLGPEGTRT